MLFLQTGELIGKTEELDIMKKAEYSRKGKDYT